MALAGRLSVVAYSTAGTSFATIDDLDSCQMTIAGDVIDTSKFGDTMHRRINGLGDYSFALSGNLAQADTAQIAIITDKLAGTNGWVMFKPNGTAGWKGQISIGDLQANSTAIGKGEFSVTLQSAGGTLTTV